MSRMQKTAEWLCKGYHYATSGDYITDWSPNNIKTIVISGKYIAVEYFVPYYDSHHSPIRFEMHEIEDIQLDKKAIDLEKPVPGILKALNSNKVFTNLEELIISNFEYDNLLYKLDDNIEDLALTGDGNILLTFPRLRDIIHTDVSFHELWNIMCQINIKDWVSYKDILIANKDKFKSCLIHVDDYSQNFYNSIFLVEENYEIDKDGGRLYNYLKDIEYSYTGNVTFDEVVNKSQALKQFFTTVNYSELEVREPEPIKQVMIPLEFMRSDLFNPNMSPMRVRSFLQESIINSLEVMFGCSRVKSLRITSGNQIVIDNIQICPAMSYDFFMALPDTLFIALFNCNKDTLNQQAMAHFKRLPNTDADISQFEEWTVTKNLRWGYVFDFKDLDYFPNIERIEINNPYRVSNAKSEISLKSFNWSLLYTNFPSLNKGGLFINNIRVSLENEPMLKAAEDDNNKAFNNILNYDNEGKYLLSQVYQIVDDTKTAKALQKVLGKDKGNAIHGKLANLGAKVTSLYRKFDID